MKNPWVEQARQDIKEAGIGRLIFWSCFIGGLIVVLAFLCSQSAYAMKPETCYEFEFKYTDGSIDAGTWCGGNTVRWVNIPGLHAIELHLSCSVDYDLPENNENNPNLGGHVIAEWSITKIKDGVFDKDCGGTPNPPTPTPTSPPPATMTPTKPPPTRTATPKPPTKTPTPPPPTITPTATSTTTATSTPTVTPTPCVVETCCDLPSAFDVLILVLLILAVILAAIGATRRRTP